MKKLLLTLVALASIPSMHGVSSSVKLQLCGLAPLGRPGEFVKLLHDYAATYAKFDGKKKTFLQNLEVLTNSETPLGKVSLQKLVIPTCNTSVDQVCSQAGGMCEQLEKNAKMVTLISALMSKMTCPGFLCSTFIPLMLSNAPIPQLKPLLGAINDTLKDATIQLFCIAGLEDKFSKTNARKWDGKKFVETPGVPLFDKNKVDSRTCKPMADKLKALADEYGMTVEELEAFLAQEA